MNSSRSIDNRFRAAQQILLVWPIGILWIVAVAFVSNAHAQDDSAKRIGRKQNYVGVFADSLTTERSKLLAPEQGVLVSGVMPGSPAAKAGLRKGDQLASYNDQKLFSARQLRQLILSDEVGRTVKFTIIRGAKFQTLEVNLEQRTVYGSADSSATQIFRIRGDRKLFGGKEIVINPPTNTKNGASKKEAPGEPPSKESEFSHLGVVIASRDGIRFQLRVNYVDEKGNPAVTMLKGTLDEIREQIGKIPEGIRDRVEQSVGRLESKTTKGPSSFRFQLQPIIEGSKRHLQLRLQQPGREKGGIRILELDLGEFDVDIDKLLKSELLEQEMKQLPAEIRKRVESTLRRAKIPEPKVRVQQSQ